MNMNETACNFEAYCCYYCTTTTTAAAAAGVTPNADDLINLSKCFGAAIRKVKRKQCKRCCI